MWKGGGHTGAQPVTSPAGAGTTDPESMLLARPPGSPPARVLALGVRGGWTASSDLHVQSPVPAATSPALVLRQCTYGHVFRQVPCCECHRGCGLVPGALFPLRRDKDLAGQLCLS